MRQPCPAIIRMQGHLGSIWTEDVAGRRKSVIIPNSLTRGWELGGLCDRALVFQKEGEA
jgi:hypothetical protein